MDALLMCGGRGTRLDAAVEKPLFEVGDEPMIEHVLTALEASVVETVYAVTSPNVPDTRAYLHDRSVTQIEAPGDGYVDDLDHALSYVDSPTLTIASDLPLIEADAIDTVLTDHDGGSVTVCVPASLKELLGVSADLSFDHDGIEVVPSGTNIVSDRDTETVYVSYDVRFAVNVNRRADGRVAERLL